MAELFFLFVCLYPPIPHLNLWSGWETAAIVGNLGMNCGSGGNTTQISFNLSFLLYSPAPLLPCSSLSFRHD